MAASQGNGGVLEFARPALSAVLLAVAACRADRRETAGLPVPGEGPGAPRITVEVLNASGKPGLARTGMRVLRRAGIDVITFGNAPASLGTLDSTRITVQRTAPGAGERGRRALGVWRSSSTAPGYSTPACSWGRTFPPPPRRGASSSTRSWPHAALISRPRLLRSTASTPRLRSRRANATI